MVSTGQFTRLALLAALVFLTITFGCSDDSPVGPEPDTLSAQQLADSAGVLLANTMQSQIDSILDYGDSTFRPRDVDFSQAHDFYASALERADTCKDAKLGLAFTNILMFMADDDFNLLVDKFKRLYDTLSFNPLRPNGVAPNIDFGGRMFVDGIPLKAARFGDIIPSPIKLERAALALAPGDPTISNLQDRLELSLLPKIQEARAHLLDLVAFPDYTFEITAGMQGNEGSSPIVLDRSDFQLFIAITYAAEAGLNVFFARNLDLPSYTVEGLEDALDRNSSFLSLKADGDDYMSAAKTRIIDAMDALKLTVDYLRAEIDTYQPYDLIEVYEEDRDDLDDVYHNADSVLDYLSGTRLLEITYNGRWYDYWNGYEWVYEYVEDTFKVDVDLRQFFDSAVSNYKLLLPTYAVTLSPVENLYINYAADHFSRTRYWNALQSIYGISMGNDAAYFGYHLPDGNTPEFYRFLAERDQTVFGWDDVENWCGTGATDLWCYWSYAQYRYEDFWESPDRLLACYDWDAATLDQWILPNPTINGLLPAMTPERLKEILIDDLGLDWYPSDCDTISVDF